MFLVVGSKTNLNLLNLVQSKNFANYYMFFCRISVKRFYKNPATVKIALCFTFTSLFRTGIAW